MNAHVPKKKGCGIEAVVDGDYKQVCGEPWAGEVWYCGGCRQRTKSPRIIDIPSAVLKTASDMETLGNTFAKAGLFGTVAKAPDEQPRVYGCGTVFSMLTGKAATCGAPHATTPGATYICNKCLEKCRPYSSTAIATPEGDAVVAWVDRAVDEENAKDIVDVLKPKTAVDILRSAADLLEERGKQYDSPGGERSMGKAVTAFNAITGRQLTVEEGWLLMGLVKDVRQYTSGKRHEDSAIDGVAYAALEAETILEQLAKK